MNRSLRRGQTLVLMALSLLLLTLMVTLTLSIGTKVREKMEVQAAADAAAYSNAAVAARVYNEISLLSRAQIGHMVSMAGVQSLISWSSLYRAHSAAIIVNYGLIGAKHAADAAKCCRPFSFCPQLCACSGLAAGLAGLKSGLANIKDLIDGMKFQGLDEAAGKQALRLQDAATRLYLTQMAEYFALRKEIEGQHLAQEIVDNARAGSAVPEEWNAPSSGDKVAANEIINPIGALTLFELLNSHHVYAAMGSRGFNFVTGRSTISPATMVLQQRLRMEYARPPDQVIVTNQGSSYFSTLPEHGQLTSIANGQYSWTDDHGTDSLTFNHPFFPCPHYTMTLPTVVLLESSSETPNQHWWLPGFLEDIMPADERHRLGACLRCPSMWPLFIDYNPLNLLNEGDNFGQPKNYAVIQRDYGVRVASGKPVDPWNLAFRFRFTPSSDASFDNRGLMLADGTNISKQTGLSAGITYYHRKGHWKEPPNLLNPYWRATLVPLTVDSGGADDVPKTLGDVGAGWAGETFKALRNQGYEGGP